MTKKTESIIAIPEWLDAATWAEFLKARKLLKKPMTEFAQSLAFRKLDAIRQAGHNPNASVEQSILHGWQGLFEPKDDAIKSAPRSDYERTKASHAREDARAGVSSAELAENARRTRERAQAIKRGLLPH